MYHLGQVPTAEILRERWPRPAPRPIVGPAVLPWDPTGSQQPGDRNPFQRGCPFGYFAQFVAPGTEGSVPYGSHAQWVRCRLIAGTSAAQVKRESGTSWRETAAIYTGAVKQTLAELPIRLPRLGAWALAGAAALAVAAAAAYGLGTGLARR